MISGEGAWEGTVATVQMSSITWGVWKFPHSFYVIRRAFSEFHGGFVRRNDVFFRH